MPFRNFPSPHVHVDSLDSASTPEAFAKREVELGTGVLTVTDHGTLQAARRVYDLCHGKKYKGQLTPILGVEAYFRDDRCPIFAAADVPKTKWWVDPLSGDTYWEEPELSRNRSKRKSLERLKGEAEKKREASEIVARLQPAWGYVDYFKYGHLTLHFLDEAAFKAGSRILSRADARAELHGSERKPLFGWSDLEELCAHNVTVSSGCLIGMVQRHIMQNGRFDLAEKYYDRLRGIVKPGNFYAEVFPHVCDRDWDASVVIRFEDNTEEKFSVFKGIKTEKAPGGKKDKEGWKARELADAWRRSAEGHGRLMAVMEDRVWVERPEPKKIIGVEAREGFVVNDCAPWAPGGDLQFGCNKAIIELAGKYHDPILISDDSHFVRPEEKIIQDIRLQQNGSWRFANSHHRFSSDDAWAYFKDVLQIPQPQFESWIDNNTAWGQRFKGFKFSERRSLPTSFYPKDTLKHTMALIKKHGRMLDTPEYWARLRAEINLLHYNGTIDLLSYFFIDEEVCDVYLHNGKLTGPGRGSAAGLLLTRLFGICHAKTLEHGLSMERFMTDDRIKAGKLPDIDQDLPSRELLVDPETGWLKKRFGDCFAQISVDTTLKLRSAVKDVARWKRAKPELGLAGFVPPEIEELTKKFIMPPQGVNDSDFVLGYTADGADEPTPGSITYDPALQEYIRLFPDEWEHVRNCLGLTRSKGRHACAYVIADEPISSFIPLTSVSGVTVTQFTASSVEAAGGLKMDFLVINSLRDIDTCLRLIQERHGSKDHDWARARSIIPMDQEVPSMRIGSEKVPLIRAIPFQGQYFDVWNLPEDVQVFREICAGQTETVFQFNTPGARKWLREFNYRKPNGSPLIDSIEAMAAFTALDRPGALNAFVSLPNKKVAPYKNPLVPFQDNGGHGTTVVKTPEPAPTPEDGRNMLQEYAARARGLPGSRDILPIFDELIPETHGVMVFQEQLQKLYQSLTGCSGVEAEEFRSNVAKKKMAAVEKAYPGFLERAGAKVGTDAAKRVWDFFITWGEYGFNKSHSICYVIISYACAWLKHHYPLEWWTAVLSHADKNEIDEDFWPFCGHLIKTPDINLSGSSFVIDGDGIRAPLSLLQGIGPTADAELNAGRPYRDIDDFCAKIAAKAKAINPSTGKKGRSALHSGIVNKLICSGVMDSLFPGKTDIAEQLPAYEAALAQAKNKKASKGVNPVLTNLKPLGRYQLKKGILTAYGEDLRRLFFEARVKNIVPSKGGYDFEHTHRNKTQNLPLADAIAHQDCQDFSPLPDGGWRWAVAAYVLDDERRNFHGHKKMAKLLLDIEGKRQEFVRWPEKDTDKLPADFPTENLKGALVVAIVSRYSENKKAALDAIIVIQPPLDLKEQPDEETSK